MSSGFLGTFWILGASILERLRREVCSRVSEPEELDMEGGEALRAAMAQPHRCRDVSELNGVEWSAQQSVCVEGWSQRQVAVETQENASSGESVLEFGQPAQKASVGGRRRFRLRRMGEEIPNANADANSRENRVEKTEESVHSTHEDHWLRWPERRWVVLGMVVKDDGGDEARLG